MTDIPAPFDEKDLLAAITANSQDLNDELLWLAANHEWTAYIGAQLFEAAGTEAINTYRLTRNPALLAVSLTVLDEALDRMDAAAPALADVAVTLGGALREAAAVFGDPELLDDAVAMGQLAVQAEVDATDPAGCWGDLAVSHKARHEIAGGTDSRADIDLAVQCLERAVGLADDDVAAAYWSNLGATLIDRYWLVGDTSDLDNAIEACGVAAEVGTQDPDLPAYLANLCLAGYLRVEAGGLSAAEIEARLDLSINAGQSAVTHRGSIHDHLTLASALLVAYEHRSDLASLSAAIDCTTAATCLDDEPADQRASAFHHLASALRQRFESSGHDPDLDASISAAQQAVALGGGVASTDAATLIALATSLNIRFELTGSGTDQEEATTLARAAVAADPEPDNQAALALILATRFERLGRRADLDEAVEIMSRLCRSASASHPRDLSNLGALLLDRYDVDADQADLDAAIEVLDEALRLIPENHVDRAGFLTNAANARSTLYELTGDPHTLDEWVDLAVTAAQVCPDGTIDQPAVLCSVSAAYRTRFAERGLLADIDLAVSAAERAVPDDGGEHHHASHAHGVLAAGLRTRFEVTGDDSDLAAAVRHSRASVETSDPESHAYPARLTILGACLLTTYEVTGSVHLLDEAVTVGRQAIEHPACDARLRGAAASNLGIALLTRFELRDSLHDLMDAVAECQGATDVTPRTSPSRPARLSNLANALRALAERTDSEPARLAAIEHAKASVDECDSAQAQRATYLTNLSAILADAGENDGAVAAAREAASCTFPSTSMPLYESNLGVALRARYQATGDRQSLDEAIGLLRKAHREGAPGGTAALALGHALNDRYLLIGATEDREEALNALRAATSAMLATPAIKLAGLRSLGAILMAEGRWSAASAAYSTSVALLTESVWHGLDRRSKEAELAGLSSLGTQACSAALAAGDADLALESLEAGRAVIWNQHAAHRPDAARLEGIPDVTITRLVEVGALLSMSEGRAMWVQNPFDSRL
mgnify:FL=1